MNWSRSSKVGLAALLLLCAAVAPAGAVSVNTQGVPDGERVGQQTSATYSFEELYDQYDQWTLRGETQLEQATWTVSLYDQTGSRVARNTYNGASFNQTVAAAEDVNRVEVNVTGAVPSVTNFSYDPAQTFTMAAFTQSQQGGTSSAIGEPTEVRYYTENSREARSAIDEAASAVESADSAEAEELLSSAISAYNAGNFENAVNLAGQASETAQEAQQSQQTTQLLVYAGVGLLVLLVIAGAVYWFLNNRDTNDPLS
jgi:cobalamin biosynthesis Mg chelatase CobN